MRTIEKSKKMKVTLKEWIVYIMIAMIIGILVPIMMNSVGTGYKQNDTIVHTEETNEEKLTHSVDKLTEAINKLSEVERSKR